MRAFFLTILFPRIISQGRLYLSNRNSFTTPSSSSPPRPITISQRSPSPTTAEPSNLLPPLPEPEPEPQPVDKAHGSQFDLYFLQSSILLDGLLTALVGLADKGWEMYLAAAVLPFASGTGSAVKGVAMDLVGGDEKADALSGIALIEKLGKSISIILHDLHNHRDLVLPAIQSSTWTDWVRIRPTVNANLNLVAQVSTISLFGFVFSALSEIGIPTAVFLANGVSSYLKSLIFILHPPSSIL